MADATNTVPAGWRGFLGDVSHYARLHHADTNAAKVRMVLASSSLWALGVYRFGRWAYRPRPRWVLLPLKAAYNALFQLSLRLCKVSIGLSADVGPDVWLASNRVVVISPGSRVGRGVTFHGGNTLGVGGRGGARGHPTIGAGVTLAPGAVVVGPVSISPGSVVGPNTVVSRTVDSAGVLGAPAERVDAALAAGLVPEPGAV